MKNKERGKYTWLPAGIAVVLIAVMIVGVYFQAIGQKSEKYRIVCLGDSILGNVRDETSVTSVMESILGEEVANGAFGGTCASLSNTGYRPTFYEDSINLTMLADAIADKDFFVQLCDISSNNFTLPYFEDCLRELSTIDFTQAEILFIEHGINDYSAGRPVDNPDNPKDVFTYAGALRYSIEKLQEAYPKLQIVLVTPVYCYFQDRGMDSEQADFGHGVLEAYVEAERQVAEEYGLPCIDNFANLGVNRDTIDEYAVDGIHLNEKGRALLANALAEYVKSNSEGEK